MADAARVRDIEVLRDLAVALRKFCNTLEESLVAIERHSQETHDWLAERVRASRMRVQQCEEGLRQARRQVGRSNHDADSGYRGEEDVVAAAERELAHAQRMLEVTVSWFRRVDVATERYRDQAARLRSLISDHASNACAFLERRCATLEEYVALQATPGASTSLPLSWLRSSEAGLFASPIGGPLSYSWGEPAYQPRGTPAMSGLGTPVSAYTPSWVFQRGAELILGFGTIGPPGALPFLATVPAPASSYLSLRLGSDLQWHTPPGFGTVPASHTLRLSTGALNLSTGAFQYVPPLSILPLGALPSLATGGSTDTRLFTPLWGVYPGMNPPAVGGLGVPGATDYGLRS